MIFFNDSSLNAIKGNIDTFDYIKNLTKKNFLHCKKYHKQYQKANGNLKENTYVRYLRKRTNIPNT